MTRPNPLRQVGGRAALIEALRDTGVASDDARADDILIALEARGYVVAKAPRNHTRHGTESRYASGCRCDDCRDAHRLYARERRARRLKEGPPETVAHGSATTSANWGCNCRECLDASTRKITAANALTVPDAHHNGHQWTGPELEVALRPDLTAAQASKMLGRTLSAVRRIRSRNSTDPRIQNLAGLAAPLIEDASAPA